jgi:hypothetical protein
VYYAGVEALGSHEAEAFTRDIGVLCQDYVGRQLRLIPAGKVIPEIVYDDDQRSVDWVVVFDDLVVLVEVKATRMTHLGRIGANRLSDDLKRCLGKAYKQVNRTDQLLTDGHRAFADIPADRPRIAIIGTLEPYWAANSAFVAEFLPEPTVLTTVASVREIERLVDVLATLGGPRTLTEMLADPERRTWNLANALPDIEVPKNPILDSAWKSFPFPGGPT